MWRTFKCGWQYCEAGPVCCCERLCQLENTEMSRKLWEISCYIVVAEILNRESRDGRTLSGLWSFISTLLDLIGKVT